MYRSAESLTTTIPSAEFESYVDDCAYTETSSTVDMVVLRTPLSLATSMKQCQELPQTNKDLVSRSGSVMLQIKKKRLFRRKTFKQYHWVTHGRQCLLFFESEVDRDMWLSDDSSKLLIERNQLIAYCLNFGNDSISRNILGYKCTHLYSKRYRKFGTLCLFKLFQWRLSDDDEDGHISSRQVGTFASSDPAQVEYLFETVRDILRSGLVNTSLQQRICAKSSSPHANDQIDKFNTLEYHDEFNEWLFRVRLVDSGFIIYRNQTVQPNSMNENSLTLSSSSSSIIH